MPISQCVLKHFNIISNSVYLDKISSFKSTSQFKGPRTRLMKTDVYHIKQETSNRIFLNIFLFLAQKIFRRKLPTPPILGEPFFVLDNSNIRAIK